MLGNLLKPFTTATAGGTVFRDVFIMISTMLGLLGMVGVLSPEQVEELKKIVEDLSGQWPAIMLALGTIGAAGMSIYRALFKSSSNKAAEVAKEVDAKIPPAETVVIKTPGDQADIRVAATK